VLHDFYVAFKHVNKLLRLVFVTGITQLARTAIGQSISNITDISLSSQYSAICGFTAREVDSYFGPCYEEALENLVSVGSLPKGATASDLRLKLLEWYDGYNFSMIPSKGERVLNPLSVTSFFTEMRLDKYWVKSGPPTFLAQQIRLRPGLFFSNVTGPVEGGVGHTSGDLGSFPIDYKDPGPLLFQLGYLTADEGTLKTNQGRALLRGPQGPQHRGRRGLADGNLQKPVPACFLQDWN
jgi:hypothetical protein